MPDTVPVPVSKRTRLGEPQRQPALAPTDTRPPKRFVIHACPTPVYRRAARGGIEFTAYFARFCDDKAVTIKPCVATRLTPLTVDSRSEASNDLRTRGDPSSSSRAAPHSFHRVAKHTTAHTSKVAQKARCGRAKRPQLRDPGRVGESRSPRRVSTEVEEVPRAEHEVLDAGRASEAQRLDRRDQRIELIFMVKFDGLRW
jgi:hypothetical protein